MDINIYKVLLSVREVIEKGYQDGDTNILEGAVFMLSTILEMLPEGLKTEEEIFIHSHIEILIEVASLYKDNIFYN